MNIFKHGAAIMALALMLTITGCGPEEDSDTDIQVTTTDSGVTRDTIHDTTTVIVHPPDTVERRDTVVVKRTDTVTRRDTVLRPTVSTAERRRIDAWLAAHTSDLNQYGDPIGTVYTGGTPLYDERTGRSIDKYTYIVRRHPARPWTQPPVTPVTPNPPPVESRPTESRPRR